MSRFIRPYAATVHGWSAHVKCGVTESQSKRKERGVIVEDISATGSGRLVVVHGKLSHVSRDADGQVARRIHISEEHTGDRVAGFLAKIPAFKNSRDFRCK